MLKIKAFGDEQEIILEEAYYTNNRIAIGAFCADTGEKWGMLTVNVPGSELSEDEIIIKNYSENKDWVPQVLEQLPEMFEDTGKIVETGFVSCPVYKYKRKELC